MFVSINSPLEKTVGPCGIVNPLISKSKLENIVFKNKREREREGKRKGNTKPKM